MVMPGPAVVLLSMNDEVLAEATGDWMSENGLVVLREPVAERLAARCEARPPSVLVLDTDGAGLTDDQLAACLAGVSMAAPACRVILTGSMLTEHAPGPLVPHAHAFLPKPIDAVLLLQTVRQAGESAARDAELTTHRARTDELQEELARLKEALTAAQHQAGLLQVAHGLLHELKNILSIMSVSAHVLNRRAGEESLPDNVRKHFETFVTQTGRLQEQVLRFGILSKGESPGSARSVRLNDVVRSLVPLLSHSCSLRRITIEQELDEHVPPIAVDPGAIRQILINLVLNARDALKDGGTIYVRTAVEETGTQTRAVLEVADTGAGVPEALWEKIFEPFFTTKTPGEGTGLGLAMARETARTLKGDLELLPPARASEPGARFRLTLPAGGGSTPAPRREKKSSRPAESASLTATPYPAPEDAP